MMRQHPYGLSLDICVLACIGWSSTGGIIVLTSVEKSENKILWGWVPIPHTLSPLPLMGAYPLTFDALQHIPKGFVLFAL